MRSLNSDEAKQNFVSRVQDLSSTHSRVMDLNHKMREYTILGLEPGERYKVILKTITGNVVTRQAISDVILTCPLHSEHATLIVQILR